MLKIAFIMLGGGLGATFRHLVCTALNQTGTSFPAGTLTANLVGSFLIGLLWCFLEEVKLNPEIRLFIFTGFLGGFTTFSTFAKDAVELFKAGEWKPALVYVGASNILGILLVFGGYALAKQLMISVKG